MPSSPKDTPKEISNLDEKESDEVEEINPDEELQTVTDETKEPDEEPQESLTPPLLPNMKVKPTEDEKEKEKEVKVKRADWDMFADQDIFKADTNVNVV